MLTRKRKIAPGRNARPLPIIAVFCALSFTLLTGGATAQADENIDKFYGAFVGEAHQMADDGAMDKTVVRDIDVTIRAYGRGFSIDWITVWHAGNRLADDVKRRQDTKVFLPSDIDGVYRFAPPKDRFKKAEAHDLLAGDPIIWARGYGKTLSVYTLSMDEDGFSVLTIYERELIAEGKRMALSFRRIINGQETKKVEGELVRAAE